MSSQPSRWDHRPGRKRRDGGDPAWRSHEKSSARRTGGADSPSPLRGDGTSRIGRYEFIRECKHSVGESIGVKAAWLKKLDGEASAAGKMPLLVLGFGHVGPGVDSQWACVPLRDLIRMLT